MLSLTQKPMGTLADAVVRSRAVPGWLRDTLLVCLFSGGVAACAQISVPLPFTPVPVTGQTLAVLFTGAVLGWRRGLLALALYLAEGSLGLPVFAGGAAGLARLFGPTGGYLLAYPPAAALTGLLAERGWDRRPAGAALMMLPGNLLIFAMGVAWLAPFVGGPGPAVVKGLLPFLPGDLIKIGLAAILLPGGWALVRRNQPNHEFDKTIPGP